MAVSTTTFAQRMKLINSGKTTSWTVPGSGLADLRDERSFLNKAPVKMQKKSTQKRRNPLMFVVALVVGAISVIAARWIDFTYFDTAMAFAAEKGVDATSILGNLPISLSLALAVLISLIATMVLGLRSKVTLPLQMAGFVGALLYEAELVAFAPDVYAKFYPQSWVADMMANATLLT
ncbi:MAG: hypothetical protein ACSHWY_10835 [Octadecabacter sp.]